MTQVSSTSIESEPAQEPWIWFLRSGLLLAVGLTILIVPVAFWLTGGRGTPWAQDLMAAWLPALALGLGTLARRRSQGGLSLGFLLGGTVGLALSLLLATTFLRGFGVLLPPMIGLALGLLDGIGETRFRGYRTTVLAATSIAAAIATGLAARQGLTILVPAILFGVLIGTLVGMRADPSRGWIGGVRRPPWPLALASTVLMIAYFFLMLDEFRRGQSQTLGDLPPITSAVAFILLSIVVAPILSFSLGSSISTWLRPRLEIYRELVHYLRAMYVPIGAFALGYSLILLLFSGFYGSLFHLNPAHFGSPTPPPPASEWFFFSLYSAVGTSYSSIRPATPLAHLFLGAQTIVGVGWAVVVFAAVMTHLQPQLAAISNRAHQRSSEPPERGPSTRH